MSASTSKKKLYAYLKGYEVACFTGKPLDQVTGSICQLMVDEIRVYFPDQQDPDAIVKPITAYVDRFLIGFYRRMRDLKTPAQVALLAGKAKESRKLLDDIVSHLVTNQDVLEAAALLSGQQDPTDFCRKCPWYMNKRFCMLFAYENQEECSILKGNFKVPEYRHLALALIKLTYTLISDLGVEPGYLANYYTLFTNITSMGHIYELMNLSGEERIKYIKESKDILTSKGVDHSDPRWIKADKLLTEVFSDIRDGKLPYVRSLSRQLRRMESFLNSPFDIETDYYLSLKSSGQSRFTGTSMSLVSSAFEIDPHKLNDVVKRFDEHIGYTSYYANIPEGFDLQTFVSTVIVGINNPSKTDPRIVHLTDNATQDRCKWVHRRLMALLKCLGFDCTHNQGEGREFLRKLTEEWYLADNPDERIGIYCTDFSRATDYLDQYYSHRIIEFIFNSPEVADFWDYVSTLPKKIIYSKDNSEVIHQTNGQPQGMLGSFPMLALCHIFLFLMDMKEMGLENYPPEQYFRVLGDDAVFNTIVPERYFIDEDFKYDEEGIPRSMLEMAHFEKCIYYAGLKVNYGKSATAHMNGFEAKLDFAKVTYRNGKLFSPIPFRLAMSYSDSLDSKLATLIWRADRGEPHTQDLLDVIIDYYSPEEDRELYRNTLRCGIFPFLKSLEQPGIYPENFVSLMSYASCISTLQAGLAFTIAKDRARDATDFDQYDEAMRTVFQTRHLLRLDKIDTHHKVMDVVSRNATILQLMHNIYGITEFEDQFMALCVSSLFQEDHEDAYWFIFELEEYHRRLQMLINNSASEDKRWLEDNLPLLDIRESRYNIGSVFNNLSLFCATRGNTKGPRNDVYIFRKAFDLYKSITQVLFQPDESVDV